MPAQSKPPRPLDTDRDPWERQTGETSKQYQAFCIYRDLGQGRSIRLVAEALGRSRRTLEMNSVKWQWVIRSAEYDSHLDREMRLSNEAKIKAARDDYVLMARSIREKIAGRLISLNPDEIRAVSIPNMLQTVVNIEMSALGVTDTGSVEYDLSGPGGGLRVTSGAAPIINVYFDDGENTSVSDGSELDTAT